VALLLSLVIVVVLSLTLTTLLVLQFLEVLPGGLSVIMTLSLLACLVVLGKALFERALSIPSIYRGSTPVVRYHGR